MSKVNDWLKNSFTPAMNKFSRNVWISTLKDSINGVMPLIFLGSIFSLLTLPGNLFQWSWYPDFWVPNGWTMGMVSIIMAFLIPYHYLVKKKMRKARIIAGISGLILFSICISPQLTQDQAVGFGHSLFGTGGMFVAIITGITSGLIIKTFGNFSFFKEDSALPDFVRQWFDQLLPIACIVVLGWVVTDILQFNICELILNCMSPIQGATETFWVFVFIHTFDTILFSMGISSWTLTPITMPLMLSAIEANIAGTASNIYTTSFLYAYLAPGGLGCSLALAILLVRSKSRKLKALGKAGIIPCVFNINEPVVFGCVVWNPILMVPMILSGLVSPILGYLFTKVITLAVIPNILFQLWYIPYPICTWMATGGSFTSCLLAIMIFAASMLIYYPFVKVYEKQCIAEENEELKNLSLSE